MSISYMEKTQEEQRVWLIEKLKAENPVYRKIPTPGDEQGQKDLLRSLMNVRQAKPVSEEFRSIQDAYLRRENMKRGINSRLKNKMILSYCDQAVALHSSKLFGECSAFYVKIVSELLAIEWYIELISTFLK